MNELWDLDEAKLSVWEDCKHAAISAKVLFTERANVHVYDQALFKEVLACSLPNLQQQMFLRMLFASQGDLWPGRRGSSFFYLSTLENLQPTVLHARYVSWPSFHVSPIWSWENDDALVLYRLHKDLHCLVCLHPVTARSIFKQTHTLSPSTAAFHINSPLACHHPPLLSLNFATPGPIAQSLWRLLLQRWACQSASGCIFMSLIMVSWRGVLVIPILRTVIPEWGATLNGRWLCPTRILQAAHPSPLTCWRFFLGVCYHSSSWH